MTPRNCSSLFWLRREHATLAVPAADRAGDPEADREAAEVVAGGPVAVDPAAGQVGAVVEAATGDPVAEDPVADREAAALVAVAAVAGGPAEVDLVVGPVVVALAEVAVPAADRVAEAVRQVPMLADGVLADRLAVPAAALQQVAVAVVTERQAALDGCRPVAEEAEEGPPEVKLHAIQMQL